MRIRTFLPFMRSISLGKASVRRSGWIMPSTWKRKLLLPSNHTGTTGTPACRISLITGAFQRGSATALSSVR